jgi:hypothetical protein
MTIRKLGTLLLAAALAFTPSVSHAQQATAGAKLAGEWDGDLALDAGVHHLALIFHGADSTLTGYVNDGGQGFGNMDDLKASGDTVRFSVQGLAFTGVVRGSKMDIDLIVFNGNHRKFSAVKLDEKAKPERDDASGS